MTTKTAISKIELQHQEDYVTAYSTGTHIIVRNPRDRSQWLVLEAGQYIHPASAIVIASTRRECLERLTERLSS